MEYICAEVLFYFRRCLPTGQQEETHAKTYWADNNNLSLMRSFDNQSCLLFNEKDYNSNNPEILKAIKTCFCSISDLCVKTFQLIAKISAQNQHGPLRKTKNWHSLHLRRCRQWLYAEIRRVLQVNPKRLPQKDHRRREHRLPRGPWGAHHQWKGRHC